MNETMVTNAKLVLIRAACGLTDAVQSGDETEAAINHLMRAARHLDRCKSMNRKAYEAGLEALYDGGIKDE